MRKPAIWVPTRSDTKLACSWKFSLSPTGSASRTDLSQLANGIWEIYAGCSSFLHVSFVAKIGYIPQFKASNARDQDEVSSDLARMGNFGFRK